MEPFTNDQLLKMLDSENGQLSFMAAQELTYQLNQQLSDRLSKKAGPVDEDKIYYQIKEQHFIDIHNACIADAISGEIRVNDLQEYIRYKEDCIFALEEGLSDYSLTFAQAALWIQTGECIAILS